MYTSNFCVRSYVREFTVEKTCEYNSLFSLPFASSCIVVQTPARKSFFFNSTPMSFIANGKKSNEKEKFFPYNLINDFLLYTTLTAFLILDSRFLFTAQSFMLIHREKDYIKDIVQNSNNDNASNNKCTRKRKSVLMVFVTPIKHFS